MKTQSFHDYRWSTIIALKPLFKICCCSASANIFHIALPFSYWFKIRNQSLDHPDRLLEVTKIYNSRETYFFTIACEGGGGWCLWFNSPILM